MCMNCVGSCPHDSLQFKLLPQGERSCLARSGPAQTITGLAAGAAMVPLMRANTGLGKSRNERLLRPPGSLDEPEFLSRCIRCGECMKVCPNTRCIPRSIRPAWKGLWTPTLVPRIGYCEPSCVLCSEVCPTGAIWQITPKEKGWVVGVGAAEASRFAWGRRFTIAAAACRGPWPPSASSAKSGARFRPRPFMCKRRR
jgi:ferredoxin